MRFRWTAVRYGVPPQEPDPLPPPGETNFRLLGREVKRENPTKCDSSHLKFVATGVYAYGVYRPEELTTVHVVAPFLLPQVKAQFPAGLPDATVAKDILWWGVRKAAGRPSPLFRQQEPTSPTTDLVYLNGVALPSAATPADSLVQPAATAPASIVSPDSVLFGLLAGGYQPNPGG